MDKPNPDELLKSISAGVQFTAKEQGTTVLGPEDEAYLNKMIAAVRAGKPAVLIVEDSDDKLKYMFSMATRPEAISMLGKVIEATGRRLRDAD